MVIHHGVGANKLASLLDEIDKSNTDDEENDIIGRVYEYFLGKIALAEGKGKGEFYTPKCIVNLIAEMIEPYHGILYECGYPHVTIDDVYKEVLEQAENSKKYAS